MAKRKAMETIKSVGGKTITGIKLGSAAASLTKLGMKLSRMSGAVASGAAGTGADGKGAPIKSISGDTSLLPGLTAGKGTPIKSISGDTDLLPGLTAGKGDPTTSVSGDIVTEQEPKPKCEEQVNKTIQNMKKIMGLARSGATLFRLARSGSKLFNTLSASGGGDQGEVEESVRHKDPGSVSSFSSYEFTSNLGLSETGTTNQDFLRSSETILGDVSEQINNTEGRVIF